MSRFTRLLSLISLVVTVSAGVIVQRDPVTPARILSADPSTISAVSIAVRIADPPVPDGYAFVFGPIDGANVAPGDVQACANECSTHSPDSVGGACQYFNMWRTLVVGLPITYNCAMYYIPTDASTATNTGVLGVLRVSSSRGYRRISYLPDGGFESYNPGAFDFIESDANWVGTSPPGGFPDATIFYDQLHARTGHSVALLGSATGVDADAGTLAPTAPLNTVEGQTYSISFFEQSLSSGPVPSIDVVWNGEPVLTVHGQESWTYYEVEVTAAGNDLLGFHGGAAPAWSFIDDVAVFAL
ncbi:hypothetical protein BDN72DRAFT_877526 [Pluteus cervinus]|uniref:Uncharacterized protein n=1 Tax=Pluteus cervinus TaxID=181527 RepID=A0ACD3AZU1_9AGAR|nr:hypothetical protein BDN72DRAFT_877526 [Pluteus cervinus]